MDGRVYPGWPARPEAQSEARAGGAGAVVACTHDHVSCRSRQGVGTEYLGPFNDSRTVLTRAGTVRHIDPGAGGLERRGFRAVYRRLAGVTGPRLRVRRRKCSKSGLEGVSDLSAGSLEPIGVAIGPENLASSVQSLKQQQLSVAAHFVLGDAK